MASSLGAELTLWGDGQEQHMRQQDASARAEPKSAISRARAEAFTY